MSRILPCTTSGHPRLAVALAFACAACAKQHSADPPPAQSSSEKIPGDSPTDHVHVAPEVAGMLANGPCEARVRVPLEQHLLARDDNGGTRRIVFMISPGEKLCLIGSESLADLHLVQGPIALDAQPQALISAELQVLAMGTVLVIKN